MDISNRLKCIVKHIDKCESIIDVGSDHGYIPIYTVKNNIVKMKYHKYYEAKRKEKYFIVYIRTDNLESAIKFDGDDRSIPSSVWTCLDNFFILSGKEEYVFCDAVDTVIREANSLDK